MPSKEGQPTPEPRRTETVTSPLLCGDGVDEETFEEFASRRAEQGAKALIDIRRGDGEKSSEGGS